MSKAGVKGNEDSPEKLKLKNETNFCNKLQK